ncbi:MAG: HD domain-containing phosphohydrolase [Dehalococcoidia bacterium]
MVEAIADFKRDDDGRAVARYPALEEVEHHFQMGRRDGSELAVIITGLDGFRIVNDCMGPIEGDAVLAAFASRVGQFVDRVGHLGGDQLIGILPNVDAPTAVALAEDMREEVAQTISTPVGKLTASIGVADYPDAALSADELLYGAQTAMYWAKAMGGDKVGYWGEMTGNGAWQRPGLVSDPVSALAAALERKLRAGRGQLARSAWYAGKVAAELGVRPDERTLIENAALLHDVGKLAIPDDVLHKPGFLSEREKAAAKSHPEIGAVVISRLPQLAGAGPIIAHHHEHYDGSGYPHRLMGDDIPIGARIILVSDAFDAMTTYRSYKSVISLQEAVYELRRCSGQQFDRRVVDAFISIVGREGLQALHWSQNRR